MYASQLRKQKQPWPWPPGRPGHGFREKYPEGSERMCTRCRQWFPQNKEWFRYRRQKSKNGKRWYHFLDCYCLGCSRETSRIASRKRRAEGRDVLDKKYRPEYRARYRELHRERIRAYDRLYYLKNRARRLAQMRRYRSVPRCQDRGRESTGVSIG